MHACEARSAAWSSEDATAEGIAMEQGRTLAEELAERLKAAEERAEQELKRHETALASMEEKHKAQLELMELQTERRLNEMEAAQTPSRGRGGCADCFAHHECGA